MSDQLISRADLNGIERRLSSVLNGIASLESDQQQIAAALAHLHGEFSAFVDADARQKQLQLAETRLVKVRQELEEKFGFYGEVRRRATGILQALDAGVVTHQSVQDATEEMMISAPGYWLAPALVALAAWIRGERPLAEKALGEALRRDDYKTSLYFALVLRRHGRRAAVSAWLSRFYAHQDPAALDREFVVLLDAVAGGIFGPEARAVTSTCTQQWLRELSERVGFVEEQERRWSQALAALTPAEPPSRYPTLEKVSPTWDRLKWSLSAGYLHARVRDHFAGIFEGAVTQSPRLQEEVDRLLAKLVSEFDDEELPLRARQRELEIIVDEAGDVDAAGRRNDAEQRVFAEKHDFTALLTNAAMHPETSGATRATQRFAVALSKDWVISAYDQVTASARGAYPAELAVKVEGWEGTIRDGSEEDALVQSLLAWLDQREAEELAKLGGMGAKIVMSIGAGLMVMAIMGGVSLLILGAIAVVGGWVSWNSTQTARTNVQRRFRDARAEGPRVVKAAVAEAVDARAELAREDARAEETRAYLAAISPDQYTLTRDAEPRAVIA